MKVKCPLAGEECKEKVDGYEFEGWCCGNYEDCFKFSTIKTLEMHPASEWLDYIDKWKAKFK